MRRVFAIASLAAGALMLLAPTAQALVEEEFTYSGGEQEFTVPAGVHKIGAKATGGTGGAAGAVSGGEAAQASSYLSVTPGDTLYVEVGGTGQSEAEGGAGGFNGGGSGAGGGGGASDIRTVSRSVELSTEDTRLLVAGGGGGAGASGETTGGAGGAAGEPGAATIYPGGGAGTSMEGGAGGVSECEFGGPNKNGVTGGLGSGGAGGAAEVEIGPGGGGGGGFYGGGGGAGSCFVASSGGGGGSSLLPGGGLLTLTTEPPSVEIVYAKPPTIAISSPTPDTTVTQGEVLTASYTCSSPDAPPIPIGKCSGSVADGAALDTSTPGLHTLTVEAEDAAENTASASVSYTVVAPPPGPPAPKSSTPPPALPDTTISGHPKPTVKTKKRKARVKFSFSSDLAGATFMCQLDKGSFAPCTSPKTYRVKKGRHTFSVEAVGPAGTDPSPATFSFKVKKKK